MKLFPMLIVLAVCALSACSTTSDDSAMYAGAKVMGPLQVPPDLNQPVDNEGSDAATTYLDYQKSQGTGGDGKVLRDFQGMHFVREGNQFWLDINDTPANVWQSLRLFFNRMGFKIVSAQPALGLLQTNYQQNSANIPSNWFLKMLHKLSSSGLMDSYRAHLEYDKDKNITRVFIAHQGLREVSSGDSNIKIDSSYWAVRPSDPELETEMLMRFMQYRGMGGKQARQEVAEAKPVVVASLQQTPEGYVLQYNDSFARVWRLVGIALDRIGMLVEDRNRSAGVYYIQIPDTFELDDKNGLFSSSKKPSNTKYLLSVQDKGDHTRITVKARGEAGKEFAAVSKKILDEIKNNLQ